MACIPRRRAVERRLVLAVSALMTLLATHADAEAPAAAGSLEIEACDAAGEGIAAECGRLWVHENRAARTGRVIPIYFIRIPAREGASHVDPFFYLAGGPGEHASRFVERFNIDYYRARQIVIVDQRGTGNSNSLDCVEYDFSAAPGAFRRVFEERFVSPPQFRDCLPTLKDGGSDLKQYTTSAITDDINDLRAALDYEQINLVGGSYGTTLALEYIRRHGESVRAALLFGVIPPNVLQNETLPTDLDAMLEGLFDACRTDAACAEHFPEFEAELRTVLAHIRDKPKMVSMTNPATGVEEHVPLNYDSLVSALRYQLYSVHQAATLPLFAHLAHGGAYEHIAGVLPQVLTLVPDIVAEGMWLSVRCAEEFPALNVPAARAAAEGTIMGTQRLDDLIDSCAFWPKGRMSDNFLEPVISDVPVLMLTGDADPASPPWMAKQAARTLSRGRLITVANSSHFDLINDCTAPLIQTFFDAASANDLDDTCATQRSRPPFVLSLDALDDDAAAG